jgi:MGT family glycosyltransferase
MTHNTYLFALVDGGGTVPPELAAVRLLVEHGHDVTVLAEDTMHDEVLATGARWLPWVQAPNRPTRRMEDDPYRDWECKNPMQLFDRLVERQFVGPAAAYAADVDAALAQTRPDVVVCSFFALGAMVAAEAAGIPFRVLMPNVYLLPAEGKPPFGLGLQPARGPVGRLRDRAINRFTTRQWDRKGLPGLNDLRRTRGLAPLEHFFDQIHRADREIVMTSPAFDFVGEMPPNVVYVGPVLDDAAWCDAWVPPAGDKPLVLVAMSSTFQDQAAGLQRVVDALATLPVRAIVTTGPAVDPSSVVAAPNVTVVRSAPHTDVLRHAAAVVNHGGHGTVMKALAAGVPQLVMPHGRDQADNAARVVARGAGLTVKRTADGRAIARAVERLLAEPGFADAARRLGADVRLDADGGALVTELVRSGAVCLSP